MSESHGPPEAPTAPGPTPPEAGPVYGPIHRYRLPPDELHPSSPGGVAPHPSPPAPPAGDAYAQVPLVGPPPNARPGTYAPPWSPAGPWPATGRDDHATWARRVVGSVIDSLPAWVAVGVPIAGYLPTYLGFLRGDLSVPPSYPLVVVGSLLCLAAFGWTVYNRWFLAGRTGRTLGRRVMSTWLVDQATGRPVGAFHAFLRDLLHVLDGFGCVGYLWPLWDDERQTLADKIAQTVVVRTAVPPLTDLERRAG